MNECNLISDSELERFARDQWVKARNYLSAHFSMPEEDCRDIYQDSLVVLWENIRNGKLTELTASLSCYFISICRNKALELTRKQIKEESIRVSYDSERIDAILELDDTPARQERERVIRRIVKVLPEPCAAILWGFYRDGMSMSQLAVMLGYSGADTVKTMKYRCVGHFKKRFNEIKNKFYN